MVGPEAVSNVSNPPDLGTLENFLLKSADNEVQAVQAKDLDLPDRSEDQGICDTFLQAMSY